MACQASRQVCVPRDRRFASLPQRNLRLREFPQWSMADRMTFYAAAARGTDHAVRDWGRWEQTGEESGPTVAAARAVAIKLPREGRVLLEGHPEVSPWIQGLGTLCSRCRPVGFEEDLRQRRLADLGVATRAEDGEAALRGQRLARLRRAWAPQGARRVVVSI